MTEAERLSALLTKRLSDTRYGEALALIKKNARGRIWLVGGAVSRLLASELYGGSTATHDFDFLVEEETIKPTVPDGWTMERKKHGNPTFTREDVEVDLFPLATHDHIRRNGLEPTIEHFLEGTPFTIQALAYDVDEKRLIGDAGITALLTKRLAVNNLEQAREIAKHKGVTIDERMGRKAESMGFSFAPCGE